MARLPIMPIFTDALMADTTRLSAEEFGVYVLILLATWRNNGNPLPDDDRELARVARVGSNHWRTKLKPRLTQFFDISDGYWHQKKLESVWESTIKFSEMQRSKGKKSGEARRAQVLDANNNDADPGSTPVKIGFEPSLSKPKDKKRTLNGSGAGKWSRAADVAPEISKAVVADSNGTSQPLGPKEGQWRVRLAAYLKRPASWDGNWGPPPTDPRCWFLVDPASVTYAPLLDEFGLRPPLDCWRK